MIFLNMSQMFSNTYLWIPKARSTPHDKVQDLVQAIEGLDLELLQHIVGRAIVRHGLELVPKVNKIQYHEQKRT